MHLSLMRFALGQGTVDDPSDPRISEEMGLSETLA